MKERILLIEDEIELQQNLKEILEHHSFSVLTADNGIQAIFKIKKQKVDLIICDIMMPEMDGYEFLKIFRTEERNKHIPFIFLSAKVSAEDKQKGIQAGAEDYLTKPISAKLLLNSIFTNLEKKKERIFSTSAKNENILETDQSELPLKPDNSLSSLPNILENQKTDTDTTK